MAKSYSLTKLSLAITLCCVGSTAFAEINAADGNTQISKKSGVEIINIATPSQAGLSHNKYDKFNVDKQGAVLNNARQSGKSQLAGDLNANPNLKTHSATVILNEVVSRNPSTLSGKQEIFGQKADYVLANPNGISANGAGFINTPRASLVVGKPQVEQGKLKGYDVIGDKALATSGKVTSSGDVDLIAPQVNIDGDISTTEGVNIISGRNKVARDERGALTITSVEQKGAVLDGKVAGSIQAGRIRIHSTDDRATITATGADLKAKDIAVVAGNAKLNGKTTTQHSSNSGARSEKRVSIYESNSQSSQQYQATKVTADTLSIDVKNNLDISGAEIQAKSTALRGGNVHLGSEKTVATSEHVKRQSKGLWHRNEQEQSRAETVHRTSISGDDVQIVANKGKVTAEGAKVSMASGGIYGETGIQLKGAKATTTSSAEAEFKNETARLKTGTSSQNAAEQQYTASELNVKDTLVLGGKGDIQLAGVVGHIDGNAVVKNSGKTTFTAEKTQESHNLNDNQKFWGGLAGAKTVGSGKNSETIHGSDLSIKGTTLVDAEKGVTISGSRVISGQDGVVAGNKGALVIDSVQAQSSESSNSRTGTIFNITKARESSYQQTSTSHGSTLKSESNLRLSSDKNVNVIGSNVQAAGALEVAALSGINVRGAQNLVQSQSSAAGFGFNAGFDSFSATFEKDHLSANINIDNTGKQPSVSSDVTISKDKKEGTISTEAKFHAGLNIYSNNQDSQTHSYTGSHLSGGKVALNGKNVNVSGSQVSATAGDLVIKADSINTQADKNHTTSNSVSNTASVGFSGVVTNSKLTGTLGVDVAHQLTSSQENQAQVSQLSAKNNVNLAANSIRHQGTQVQAGGNVQENAKNIVHTTAQSDKQTFGRNVNVGASVTAGFDTSKALSVDATLSASGGRENAYSSTQQGTSIKGQNVNVNAQQLYDGATQYNANENVALNSRTHTLASAQNESRKDSLSAGGNVGVSVGTSDFQSVKVSGNVGANFKQGSSASSTAVQGAVNGKNVAINTGTLNSQANLNGSQNVNINADQSATFTQSTNTVSQSGGGFEASLGVGAIVLPSANVVVPTIDASAKVNGNKGDSATATAATIAGGNVNIHSNGVTSLQGTNVNGGQSAVISGKHVEVSATQGHTHNVAVNVGAGVNIGEKVSSLGINGNLGVKHENSTAYNGVNVNGQNVNVQAQQGIVLNGVGSTSNNLNLDSGKGSLNLNDQQSSTNKTDFGVGLNLKGGVADNKWTPNAGGASLDVAVVRNQNYVGTVLNTENANLNVGGNANLNGSAINANTATGSIAGNLHTETLTNKVNETSVSLAANGSGKFTAYPADKWQESAKKDWENGTIAGVNANAKIDVNAKHQSSHTQSGLNATRNHVAVAGHKTRNQPSATQNKVVSFKVEPTTKVKNYLESKYPSLSPIKAVNVQVAKDNQLVLKTNVKR